MHLFLLRLRRLLCLFSFPPKQLVKSLLPPPYQKSEIVLHIFFLWAINSCLLNHLPLLLPASTDSQLRGGAGLGHREELRQGHARAAHPVPTRQPLPLPGPCPARRILCCWRTRAGGKEPRRGVDAHRPLRDCASPRHRRRVIWEGERRQTKKTHHAFFLSQSLRVCILCAYTAKRYARIL